MLDRVRHIAPAAIDSRGFEAAIEQLTGPADKGMAGQILGIAGLLADKHDRRALRALAEDGLSRVAIKRTGRAFGRRLAQAVERRINRYPRADALLDVGHVDTSASVGMTAG